MFLFDLGVFLVVELEEVGEGACLEQSWEGDIDDLVGDYGWELLLGLALGGLVLALVEHLLVVSALFLLFLVGFPLILLVFLAIIGPLLEFDVGLDDAEELLTEEGMEFVPDHVLAAFITRCLFHLDDLLYF